MLFAVTLFVSATLLFMVQPMVGKLVLPLLGGSPAVWNACMVFFQALLLLGYLYADRLTRNPIAKKQWYIHLGVMAVPVTAFLVAVLVGGRPIAIVENLAPSDGSSAIFSVLAILTVAIGIPFFVVSTSATLLQKWFTYTGHPSARDPYFLYSASNAGSLISLLGYPIFIEPNMTQGVQTWFWAAGFLGLFALIAFCGRAAANPLGVPPGASLATATGPTPASGGKGSVKQGGGGNTQKPADNKAVLVAPPTEQPPTWGRMAKWTALAFVPSSLMLGVTFHMTTDIASIPLLWVWPLGLYLVTFIIAFGRVPPWFRVLIGNLAPVMILLLVFLLISGVNPGVGLSLLLHLMTFFAAALMCHYELARDRPSPQYLTTYFLIMSFGGVLGGIFNSLVAPVVFVHAYEYPLALIVACLMVPHLNPLTQDDKEAKMSKETALAADLAVNLSTNAYAYPVRWFFRVIDRERRLAIMLDILIPVLIGLAFWRLQKLPEDFEWYGRMLRSIAETLSISRQTVYIVITYAIPVMVCFFFVDRPVRFALTVAAILGPVTIRDAGMGAIYTERSFFGILKIERHDSKQYLLDRSLEDKPAIRWPDGEAVVMGEYRYRRLVHGTTLHGTQVYKHDRHILDDFQMLTAANPWDNLATWGAIHSFDMSQEPLTYYHRTGPVGAMFDELQRRGKHKEHVAMVGLGTGSVSCYAQKGQKLTFYEIDPAVRKLVEKPEMVLNEKELKEHGCAPITDPEVRQLVEKISGVRIYDQAAYDEKKRIYDEEDRRYQATLREFFEECKRLREAGEKIPDRPAGPTPLPVVPDIGPFSYVNDARKRGAEVEFRMGDARLKLKEDSDRKYSLLLVDAFSSDSIPVHLLTVEAVQLYLNRITDDGILALHISNKFVKLEPVVDAIAKVAVEGGLVARVWNDDAEGKHGKTASSWVVLARKPEHLGERLCSPISDYMFFSDGMYPHAELIDVAKRRYPDLKTTIEKSTGKQKDVVLDWLEKQTSDPHAQRFASWIQKYGSEHITLMAILQAETGYGFRPLRPMKSLDPWTDDYADVMRVMMIDELQKVRKFFGLPTLDDE